MGETEKTKTSADAGLLTSTTAGPLVFIGHHPGEAGHTGAFSKLVMLIALPLLPGFVFNCSAGNREQTLSHSTK